MTPINHPIELGGEVHNARLTVPHLAELERKLETPAGAILARLLQGVYVGPDNVPAAGEILEAGFRDRDIVEVIFHALAGGGMDAGRARQLTDTYVANAPRRDNWLKAAMVMLVYMQGYTPPKKPEAPTEGPKKRRRTSTTAHT